LTEFLQTEHAINAIYPHRHHLSAKVRSFIDLLAKHFHTDPAWADPRASRLIATPAGGRSPQGWAASRGAWNRRRITSPHKQQRSLVRRGVASEKHAAVDAVGAAFSKACARKHASMHSRRHGRRRGLAGFAAPAGFR